MLVATASESKTIIAAIITGLTGISAAVGGVMLTIRKVRNQVVKSSEEELQRVEGYLAEERKQRIMIEQKLYQTALLLAQHGIEPPVWELESAEKDSD